MLTAAEIESLLGSSTVQAIEAAVSAGFSAAESSADFCQGIEAVRYLLLTILAATSIVPLEGAEQRAEQLANDLVALVNEALSANSAHSRMQ